MTESTPTKHSLQDSLGLKGSSTTSKTLDRSSKNATAQKKIQTSRPKALAGVDDISYTRKRIASPATSQTTDSGIQKTINIDRRTPELTGATPSHSNAGRTLKGAHQNGSQKRRPVNTPALGQQGSTSRTHQTGDKERTPSQKAPIKNAQGRPDNDQPREQRSYLEKITGTLKKDRNTNNEKSKANKAKDPASPEKNKNAGKRNTSIGEDILHTKAAQTTISTLDTVAGKAYRAVMSNNEGKVKVKTGNKKKKYKQGVTQSIVPVKKIRYGIIETTTGKYVKILEILPIDFYSFTPNEQNRIADNFARIFNSDSSHELHLKVITDRNNPQRLIEYIKRHCEEEKYQRGIDNKTVACAQDVIEKIKRVAKESSITKRFFLIYKYEGKSNDFEEIYYDMESLRLHYTAIFADMGNTIIDHENPRDINLAQAEALYYCLNRNTWLKESLEDRLTRVGTDMNLYNISTHENRETIDADFLAPKGAKFISNNHIFIDGKYRTYLALRDDAHPQSAYAGWLDLFTASGRPGVEVDVYTKLLSREYVLRILEQRTRLDIVSAREKETNRTKHNEIMQRVNNTTSITEPMQNGEDLYDVVVIITLSADTMRELRALKTSVVKDLNTKKLFTEDSFQYTWDYYKATLPLMELPQSIFMRNKHNYLTSSLKSLYMFTAYEMYDPTGFVLGVNNKIRSNRSLVAFNIFNTNICTNANMFIVGTSGSGKTFSSEVMARSMRVSGIRVMFVLPVKGYEYERGCKEIGGTYIQLRAGGKDCVNIMGIIPEQKIDKDKLGDDVAYRNSSLLGKKIAFLITWMQLLDPKNEFKTETVSFLSAVLTKLYEKFGINEDNDSIYIDKKANKLKPMPRIIDMYNALSQYSQLLPIAKLLLEFTSGTYAHFNQQTNVDLNSKYLVFDVDQSNNNKKYLPACLFLAFDCVYGLVKQDRMSKDIIFLDEVWKMLANEAAAEQVQEMVKLIRGYGGGVISATQEIDDFLNSPYGSSIINNADSKLILRLKEPECRRVSEVLYLSEDEQSRIRSFKRGNCLLIAGQNRILADIVASEKEIEDFTTDVNELRRIATNKAIKKPKKKLPNAQG